MNFLNNKNASLVKEKTVLLVVDQEWQIRKLIPVYNYFRRCNDVLVVAYTGRIRKLLRDENVPSSHFSEYISNLQNDAIDRLADQYSDHWYLSEVEDQTIFNGISYGEVMKLPVAFRFMDTMKEIEGVLNVVDQKSVEVIVFFGRKALFCQISALVKGRIDCYFRLTLSREVIRFLFELVPRRELLLNAIALLGLYRRRKKAQMTNAYLRGNVRKTILLFYYKGHRALEPVRKALYARRTEDTDVLTIDDPRMKRLCSEQGIPFRTFDYYLSIKAKEAIEGIRFVSTFWKHCRDLPAVRYRGVNLLRGTKALESLWNSYVFSVIFYGSAIQAYLKRHKPQLVIPYIEVWPLASLLVRLCKKQQIATLMVQHGVTNDKPYYRVTWTPSLVDKLAVWGKESEDYFLQNGIASNRIAICGSPLFDKLFAAQRDMSEPSIHAEYGIPENKKIVLYITQNFSDEVKRATFMNVVNSIEHLDAVLVVKLHPSPRETIEFYNDVIGQEGMDGNNIVVLKNAPLHSLLRMSDVVVTVHSTVHVEAILFGKVVVIMHFTEGADLCAVKLGAALCVRKESETRGVIQKALYDVETQNRLKRRRDEFIERYTYKNDGRATERIVEIIEGTLYESHEVG